MAEVYLSIQAPDPVLMLPGRDSLFGRDVIQPFIIAFARAFKFKFETWMSEEIIVSGDVAIHRFSGVAEIIPRYGGDTLRQDRKCIDVWRRSPDATGSAKPSTAYSPTLPYPPI